MATATKKRYFVLRDTGTNDIKGGVRSFKDGADIDAYILQRKAQGLTVEFCNKPPTLPTLEKYVMDGVAKSIHGKRVEPDHPESWVRVMGFI